VRFTIVGAGAVGGSLGAFLVQAGHDVTLVDKVAEHVAAINATGLRIEGPRAFKARVPALLPEQVHGPLDVVVLAVKSHDTEAALAPIAPHVAPDGYVVSLQNGLEEPKVARLVGAQRTVGAFITTGAHYAGPGTIFFGGSGTIRLGELDGRTTPRLEALRDAFSAYQPTEITDNVLGYLWGKLVLGCIYFASALVDADFLELLDRTEYLPLLTEVGAEAVAVADARGVRLEAFDGFQPALMHPRTAAEWRAAIDSFDVLLDTLWRQIKRRTGIWRDLAVRRRKTEVDLRVTDLVNRGRALRLPMTLNARLAEMIHEIEDGRRPLRWQNLEELGGLARELGRTGE
jgi:2-dehydropantoate 2-reductase